jgi:splicing factor 3A subunit 1
MERIAQGDLGDESAVEAKVVPQGSTEPAVVEDVGLEPPVPEFVLDLPNISNIDL